MPASSAASERNWSAHGFIHSPRRNRLLSQCVEKLVFVYSNYKLRETTLEELQDSGDELFLGEI